MNILAVFAHPDDETMLAGGTLALLAQRGHEVTIATMAPGDCGSEEFGPETIAGIRRGEAAAATALIGAAYRCLEFRDLAIFNDDLSRRRVVEFVRRMRPDLILTSYPVDYLCDHETTSLLVRDACFCAPAPNYKTRVSDPAPALSAIPHLYFMDPVGGVGRDLEPILPDFVVNVESTFELKRQMLASHASQREWLLRQHGMDDYLLTMEAFTRQRGVQAGIACGEGFKLYRGHPYPESPLLEDLLGPDLVIRIPR